MTTQQQTIDDFGRRITALETQMRSALEEIQLNRRRYHELSQHLAPALLEIADVSRHELELRELRELVSKAKGGWGVVTVMAGVLAAVATVAINLISKLTSVGH